ncbi:uncharacterized protein LOC107637014 [Arachis ipaensis]|uniref:uncharacterized protein LOC107637014 n=1 Tax=Arachis ipaensis TaxID=130454 RepID=UPI000A2B7F9B|nr:uncharacterized protein LOC107637014 [Arachis ipaensis]
MPMTSFYQDPILKLLHLVILISHVREGRRKAGAVDAEPPCKERERVAPHHRRPGARRSCPIASPPAASSSLQLRCHQRPEPREVRPRGGTSAREETWKKDCCRSASPSSNYYSRHALSLLPLSFNHCHLCWGSSSLLNEEGEFKSASEGRKKESRWRSRSPSSRLLLPSTELVVREASPTSLLMNRLRPCCDLAQPLTPFILVSKLAQFFPVLTPFMKLNKYLIM